MQQGTIPIPTIGLLSGFKQRTSALPSYVQRAVHACRAVPCRAVLVGRVSVCRCCACCVSFVCSMHGTAPGGGDTAAVGSAHVHRARSNAHIVRARTYVHTSSVLRLSALFAPVHCSIASSNVKVIWMKVMHGREKST